MEDICQYCNAFANRHKYLANRSLRQGGDGDDGDDNGDGDDDGEVEVVEVEHEDGALTVDVTDADSVDANGELNLTEEETVMATMAESPRAFFPPIGHSVCLGLCVDCD